MRRASSRRALVIGLLVSLCALVDAQDRTTDSSDRLAIPLRTGQYHDARRLIDEMLETERTDDLKNVRALLGDGLNMRVTHVSSSFHCEVTGTGVWLPVEITGPPAASSATSVHSANWLLDTGAGFSLMSDAEATRLGLVIRESDGRVANMAGGTAAVRTAVASRVVIGRTQLEDVTFLVLPADERPWNEFPPGKQGMIGLPLAIALGALRWSRTGTCDTGSAAANGSAPGGSNLKYSRLLVINNVELEGTPTEFVLDTGNQAATQLWERFRRDFGSLVKERGRKGTKRVEQIGGATDHEVVVIPGLRLKVGGKDTSLAEANVFSRPVGDNRFHGLLGMDVLSQAMEVTIDFRSMRLTLK